jgi:hypothetical protein
VQPGSPASPRRSLNVAPLVERLEQLKRRYGAWALDEQLLRLERRVQTRHRRIAELREQQAEIERQVTWLASEIDGLNKGYYLLAAELIDRMEREHPEGWSPTSVLGYRAYDFRSDGLYGAWVKWDSPDLDAECSRFDPDEVPHTNGRCGCGIYAAKNLHDLLTEYVPGLLNGFAVGLVAMSGKVVEHERGYRAGHARVIALALSGSTTLVLTDDPAEIAAIFRDPWMRRGSPERRRRSWEQGCDDIEQYLMERAWRNQWTSVNKSE